MNQRQYLKMSIKINIYSIMMSINRDNFVISINPFMDIKKSIYGYP